MPPHAPTPDEAEQAIFIVRWWTEFLGGLIAILTALFLRAKGKGTEAVITPMSEEEIEHRMTICKQSILLAMHDELDNRDKELFEHIDRKNNQLLDHVKDIIEAGK